MEIKDLMKKQNEELSSIKKLTTNLVEAVDSRNFEFDREHLDLYEGEDEEDIADINELQRRIIDEYIKVAKPWENVTEETEE